MLDADDVAFGDLSRFSTIVLGIRAYEKRADVRAYNQRLLDFARNGGHLVVQYNKVAMNQLGAGAAGGGGGFGGDVPAAGPAGGAAAAPAAAGGPPAGAPARSSSRRGGSGPRRPRRRAPPASPYVPFPGGVTSNRVSVEEAPIRVLEDGAVELAGPNRDHGRRLRAAGCRSAVSISSARTTRATPICSRRPTRGRTTRAKSVGLLTVAKLGKGTWTYVGLGLWRQLPAGTPGAYRIMANLISRPRVK